MKHFFLLPAAVLLLLCSACNEKAQSVPSTGGVMNLTSDPEGAEITILGKNIGVTPRKTNPVPPSMYIVKFFKEGYEPKWIPVTLQAGKETSVHAVLRPVTALAMITSSPAGAKVLRDEKEVGMTPCVLSGLRAGPQAVRIVKPGYVAQEITWTVTGGRPFAGHADLISNTGTLVIRSNPSDANVFIDEQAFGMTPVSEAVEQGMRKVRLEKDGYESYLTTVTVRRGEKEEIQAELSILPMSLVIRSQPTGANVFINGKGYGMTPYTFVTKTPGKYEVTVSKDNFSGSARSITLLPGSKSEVELPLSSELGALEFVTMPGTVEVYLDGRRMGVTKPDPNKPNYSLVYRIPDIPAGRHKVDIIHKRGVPKKRVSVSCQVSKRETTRLGNVTLWVPNMVLVLKNGMRKEGRVLDPKSDPVVFEPSPGIKVDYPRSEINSLEPVRDEN